VRLPRHRRNAPGRANTQLVPLARGAGRGAHPPGVKNQSVCPDSTCSVCTGRVCKRPSASTVVNKPTRISPISAATAASSPGFSSTSSPFGLAPRHRPAPSPDRPHQATRSIRRSRFAACCDRARCSARPLGYVRAQAQGCIDTIQLQVGSAELPCRPLRPDKSCNWRASQPLCQWRREAWDLRLDSVWRH